MKKFWFDSYLWVHLAGIAVVPGALLICWLALAAGNPGLPTPIELLLIAGVGIAPVLWMQWQKPFCIYSLLIAALKPEVLTEEQRRILALFRARRNPLLLGVGPVLLGFLLIQIYYASAIAAELTPIPAPLRLVGAIISFLLANVFLEVPLSVVQVMLASDEEFASIEPVTVDSVRQNFTVFGIRVNKILPPLLSGNDKIAVD